MTFAGLCESWKVPDGADPVQSFTILTTTPNETVEWIHDRQALTIEPEDWDTWLDPKNVTILESLQQKLHGEAGLPQHWPVTPKMNKPEFEDPEAVKEIHLG